jgi:hypothetical protein
VNPPRDAHDVAGTARGAVSESKSRLTTNNLEYVASCRRRSGVKRRFASRPGTRRSCACSSAAPVASTGLVHRLAAAPAEMVGGVIAPLRLRRTPSVPRHPGPPTAADQNARAARAAALNLLRQQYFFEDIGAPGGIRTPDFLVRSQALYPTELRAHREGEFVCRNERDSDPGAESVSY